MTVKELIKELIELPLDTKVEVVTHDRRCRPHFEPVFNVYLDSYNGNTSVIINGMKEEKK